MMTRRQTASSTRPEVVAIYCPLWHNYDHASSWKGEGWCEWELMRNATPRFDGHYQPYRPTWGCFDESDPKWSAKEISLAADHGIDVFLVDWYWYSGVKIMEEALERGLLKAKNRDRMKFAIMWANHDWADYFPAPFGQEWNSWLPMRHTARDWERVIEYSIEQYFSQPNYWIVEGGLFYSIFVPGRLIDELGGTRKFREVLDKTNLRLSRAKLPPLHLNAMVSSTNGLDELKEAGFKSATGYNIIKSGKVSENLTERYEDLVEAHVWKWQEMSGSSLTYCPVVTMGWDVTPRCETDVPWPFAVSPLTGGQDYPYIHVVEGNTPELFEKLCECGLRYCVETSPKPFAMFVNAWNEWTEGSFLLPEKRYGTGYLEAIRRTFGENNPKKIRTTKECRRRGNPRA